MDGIWGKTEVSLCIYLEVCMVICSISSGGLLALSGETELGGSRSGRGNEAGASIGELYFKKYDSLDDMHFQNVVEQGLSGCSCGASESKQKFSLLGRYLVGEGSHGCLSTTFILEQPVKSGCETQVQSCEITFVERLPCGVFAGSFELQHLQKRGVCKEASVFGDTNLELPSFLSNRSLVEVHLDVDLSNFFQQGGLQLGASTAWTLSDDSGYTNVAFGTPDIFLHCKTNDGGDVGSCVSLFKDNESIPEPKEIIWSLPSGIRAHESVVSVITFSSAILSSLVIVFAAMHRSGL